MKKNNNAEGALYFDYKIDNDIASFDDKAYVVSALSDRAYKYYGKGQYDKAISDYSKIIEIYSTNVSDSFYVNAHKYLSWILSTCPDEKYRDGKRAIDLVKKTLAIRECENIGPKDARGLSCGELFSVQAAAYAETGKFEDAVNSMEKSLFMLNGGGYESLSHYYAEYLQSYRDQKPWREKKGGVPDFGGV